MKVDGESCGPVAAEVGTVSEDPSSSTENAAQTWLRGASFKEVLGSDASHKSLFVLVSHSNGEQGVLLLNKSPFSEKADDISAIINSAELSEIMKNDIFGSYDAVIPQRLNVVKSTLIYPANEKVIAKYRQEEKFIIHETAEDYQTITVEYIKKYQMDLKWLYNVLTKESEAERIIFEDPDPHNGFILSPDIKWDGKSLENLYVLAMIHRRGVRSIRDLTADDLPLLENLRSKCLSAIREKYGVRPDQIRAYFHYQPCFYHLHVHFVSLKYDAPASSTLAAVLLDDVINNIKMVPDYYKKATLTFARKGSDKLLQMFREAGRCDE
ncbi:unnamed protein product [Heligmosomoides polygyrus]|uniref:m7GpppX diphosphatase n=1 Tax=Heligmosomoides polygyrus TaxID=6339 RepID=A0A183G5C1_HELPZ|nr:unnamed protein product [Heligmosomoides polygyrus]